jgi:hypothetical protein
MRRKEAGSSRTSMLRRARCAGHGEWRSDDRSSRSRCKQRANKQAALAPAHSVTVANGSFRILATMHHEWRALPGPWCSTSPAKCQHRVPPRPGRKWGAPDRWQGQAGALPCRAPGQARPAGAVASAEKHRPGGQYLPSCDLDGQVHWQPAATLLRRWRWISDHRHTIILLPSPYSDKVLRSLSLTAGSSAG